MGLADCFMNTEAGMLSRNEEGVTNAADPVLDEATVLCFVRETLPSALTAIDESGCEARACMIDHQYVFKTQRPHRVRPRASLKEVVHLLNLAALAEVNVPRVLGFGGHRGGVEYTLMTRLPGVAARDVTLVGEARKTVLTNLGRSLRRLHSLPLGPSEDTGLFPSDKDGAEVRSRLGGGLRQAAEAIAVQHETCPLEISPEVVVERCLAVVCADYPRAALHANPGPEHVFVDPGSLEFTGIVDFGDACISHPAFEMRRWSSSADRRALITGYGSDAAIDDSFLATSRAVMVGGLMITMAGLGPGGLRADRRRAALADLAVLAAEL